MIFSIGGTGGALTGASKRALSFNEARDSGLVHGDYASKNLPPVFTAALKFKVWGKSQNLNLYFEADDGNKYLVSVHHNRETGADRKYHPRKMPEFDLATVDIQPGMKFRLITEKNRNGNTNFLWAYIL